MKDALLRGALAAGVGLILYLIVAMFIDVDGYTMLATIGGIFIGNVIIGLISK